MSESRNKRDQDSPDQAAEIAARRRWMGLAARGDAAALEAFWDGLAPKPDYDILRGPESGLVMVRGRAGGSGQAFNLGEMSVTRCSVQLPDGTAGHGYVAGRNRRQAELAALIDAMMMTGRHRARIEAELLGPLESAEAMKSERAGRQAAATKVDFFTMVRGED